MNEMIIRFCMFALDYQISMRSSRDHLVRVHPNIWQQLDSFHYQHFVQCALTMSKSNDELDFFHSLPRNHVYRKLSCRFSAIRSSSSTTKNVQSI